VHLDIQIWLRLLLSRLSMEQPIGVEIKQGIPDLLEPANREI
jgi:hypothetical protein